MNYKDKTKYHDKFGQVWESRYGSDCSAPGCTKRTHGPAYDLCADHIAEKHDPWKSRRIETLKNLGLYEDGDHPSAVIGRCKVRGLKNESFSLANLLKLSQMSLKNDAV